MSLQVLRAELDADPLGRGYSGMTHAQAAESLNVVNRERNRAAVSGDEIFNAADATEYNNLTNANKQLFLAICGRDAIDPFGSNNVAAMITLFGGGSATLATLAGIRRESLSRAQEIGLGFVVLEVDVAHARELL